MRLLLIVSSLMALSTTSIVALMSAQASSDHFAAVQGHIQDGIVSKGKVLTQNHAIALRSLVLDNAFLDIQRLVERAVKDDQDLVYGVFVNSERAALALGQVISNTATVLVMIPIALSVAATLDASVQPFMMALTVVGAAALFTPIATPVNLMVMEPGGYRFGDYWRLGIPLAAAYLVIAVLWVPLIWPF